MTNEVQGVLFDFYGTLALDDDAVVDAISRRISSDTGAAVGTVADLCGRRSAISAPPPYEDALRFVEAVELPVALLSDIDTDRLEDAIGH